MSFSVRTTDVEFEVALVIFGRHYEYGVWLVNKNLH